MGEKGGRGQGNRASASQFELLYTIAKASQKDAKENYLSLLNIYKELLHSASRSELNKYYAKTTEIHLLATRQNVAPAQPVQAPSITRSSQIKPIAPQKSFNVATLQDLYGRFNVKRLDTTTKFAVKKLFGETVTSQTRPIVAAQRGQGPRALKDVVLQVRGASISEAATSAAESIPKPFERHTSETNRHFVTATISIMFIALLAFTFLLGPGITGLSSGPAVSEGISPSSSSSTNAFDWKVPDSLVFFYHWLKTSTPTGLFGATIVNETVAETTITEPTVEPTPEVTPTIEPTPEITPSIEPIEPVVEPAPEITPEPEIIPTTPTITPLETTPAEPIIAPTPIIAPAVVAAPSFATQGFGIATTSISACGNLSGRDTYQLTASVSTDQPSCFRLTPTLGSLTLDCQGFNITGNRGANQHGINASSLGNITIKNCVITNFSDGIFFVRVRNATIINNNFINNSDDAIDLGNNNFTTISHNNFSDNFDNSIEVSGWFINITNNTFRNGRGDSLSYGIQGFRGTSTVPTSGPATFRIINNTFIDNQNDGLSIAWLNNSVIANNTFIGNGDDAITLINGTGINITGNNVGSGGDDGFVLDGTNFSFIWQNNISQKGGVSIDMYRSYKNNLTNNLLFYSGSTLVQVRLGSSNNTFTNNTFWSNDSWFLVNDTAAENNFTNTTFTTSNGSILLSFFQANKSNEINSTKLNISNNRTYLNATNLTWMNKSAVITLNNVVFSDPRPVVDYTDTNNYNTCPANVCTEIDYVGTTFRFNVSHWTSYAAQGPGPNIGLSLVYPLTNINVLKYTWFNVTVNVSCAYDDCGEINVTLDPAVGTVYNFTNCGAAGMTGPSHANCVTAYSGTTLDGLVDVGGGIQNWTVPTTGTYNIVAFGAKGGLGLTFVGGNGSKMNGTFNLTAGDKLKILVGQQGGDLAGNKAGGGGGGTFVVYSNNTPLIIAGGGSGGGGNSAPGNGQAGTINRSGTTGSTGSYVGGSGGNGGTASLGSAGGGGLNGTGNTSSCAGTGPGVAFGLGGTGGSRATCQATGDGGFGGGSGGDWCCQGASGAGGGYSGGGGTDSSGVAGAGGSFNAGAIHYNVTGGNNGNGSVSITFLGGNKGGTVSMDPSATPFYTNVTNGYNLTLLQGESRIITWFVNATGSANTYEFYAYANKISDPLITNETQTWNVTIDPTLDCGQTITSSKTLTEDLSGTGTCLIIGANDVTLDCAGYKILYDSSGSGAAYGVQAVGRTNVAVKNCVIQDGNSSGANSAGINFSSTSNSRIVNNSIVVNGTTNNYGIINRVNSLRNEISNNSISQILGGASGSGYGIMIEKASGFLNVSGNNILTNNSVAIGLSSLADNNTIWNNTFKTQAEGCSGYSIYLTNGSRNNFTSNIITIFDNPGGSFVSIAIYNIGIDASVFNLFNNNSINTTEASCDGTFGVYSSNPWSRWNNFTNNNIVGGVGLWNAPEHVFENNTMNGGFDLFYYFILSGNNISYHRLIRNDITGGITVGTGGVSPASAVGTVIEHNRLSSGLTLGASVGFANITNNSIAGTLYISTTADNNSIVGNNISTNGTAITIAGGNNTNFTNNILSNSTTWIIASPSSFANFTNTTFENANGSIRFPLRLPFNGTRSVNLSNLNISLNRARLNATNQSWLNSSAIIDLEISGLGFVVPVPGADFEDDGSYDSCSADVCTTQSSSAARLLFNVSHWTSYGAMAVNTAPTVSSLLLSSTNTSKNDTSQNLTVLISGVSDGDGDIVRNITDFRKYVVNTFVSDAILNAQFDTNISSSNDFLVRDYSTFLNNITLGADTRKPIWNSSMPIMGGSYQFDGSNDILFVKNSSALNITGPELTLEAWIRSSEATTGEYDRIVSKAIAGGADPYNAYGLVRTGGSGTVQFELATGGGGSSTSVASTAGITANAWIHLIGTYDGNRMKLYVNGVLNNTALKNGNITGTTSGVTMGGNFELGTEYYNGQIDGVRIYNRTLSENEVLTHYLEGAAGHSDLTLHADALHRDDIWVVAVTPNDGLLDGATTISNNVTINHTVLPSITQAILNSTGANTTTDNLTLYLNGFSDTDSARVVNITDWRQYTSSGFTSIAVLNLPFDTRNDSVATGGIRDYSTYGNNATLGGGLVGSAPDWNNSGIIGGTYIYDGTNDYINVPDSSSLDITGDITVAAWVLHETTSYDAWEAIVTKGDTAYRLHLCGDTGYCPGGAPNGFNFEMTGVSGSGASSTVVPAHHVWYFVVGTYDGAQSKLYVNGSLVATQTRSGSISANSAAVQIGANAEASGRNWKGAIDNVMILNRSLNASEIQAMYDDGRIGKYRTELDQNETELDDIWQVAVTPNDLNDDGITVLSNNMTITTATAPANSSCGVITQNTVLNQSVNSTGNCFSIIASNLTLDCNGKTIFWDGEGAAINATHQTNITIQNCFIIDNSTIGSNTRGINFTNVTTGLIRNNTILTNATSQAVGIEIDSVSNGASSKIVITNNTINATGSAGSQRAIRLTPSTGASFDLNITQNVLRTGGTTDNKGIEIVVANTKQLDITNNTIFVGGTSTSIGISGVASSNIKYNTIYVTSTSGISGITLQSGEGSNVSFNNITVNGTIDSVRALGIIPSVQHKINISNNNLVVVSTGLGTGPAGGISFTQLGANHTLDNNNISIYGQAGHSFAFGIGASVNFTATNTIVRAGSNIYGSNTQEMNATFVNLTIESANGSIRFPGSINITGIHNFTAFKYNLSNNTAFLNSSNLTFFNASANIVLNNLGWTDAQAVVDYTDTNSFGICPADVCTNTSYSGGVFKFNVSHWTTFSTQELYTNTAPTISSVILNTTKPSTNDTHQNLTAYVIGAADADGNQVENITDWRLYRSANFTSIAVVNLPFETNTVSAATKAIRDYSTFQNNGTLGSGNASKTPIWNASGIFGGAYTFDGTDDFINLSLDDSLKIAGAFTMMFWMNTAASGSDAGLVGTGIDNYQCTHHLGATVYCYLQTGGNNVNAAVGSGVWHHIGYTWDGTTNIDGMKLFVDGVLAATRASSYSSISGWSDFLIGSSSSYYSGSLDEIVVLNRSLSRDQIRQHYLETNGSRHLSTIVKNETSVGEIWQACVMPNDAITDGATVCSNNITILNNVPSISSVILNTTNPLTNDTNQNLTVYISGVSDFENDSVQNITDWRLWNGTNFSSIAILNMPFEGGSNDTFTKDYSTYRVNGAVSGTIWNPTSGYANSGAYLFNGADDSGNITISNMQTNFANGITVSAWFNLNALSPNWETIYGLCDSKLYIAKEGANNIIISYANSTGNQRTLYAPTISANQWHHVAVTYKNDTNVTLYIDGAVNQSEKRDEGILLDFSSAQRIGNMDSTCGLGYWPKWNGTIDNVQVFNRTLSAAQISAMYQNLSNVIVSGNTFAGDVWQSCVTPNDAIIDGATVCSNNVTMNEVPGVLANSTCGEITKTTVLNVSVNSTGNCFSIINSNLTLDCDGKTILWMGDGAAINATHQTNITVKNCFILDNSTSRTNTTGINFTNVTVGLIQNNTILTNATSSSNGIVIQGIANGLSTGIFINNNTINATGSTSSHTSIKLLANPTSNGNNTDINITNNILKTGGTTTLTGISFTNTKQTLIENNTFFVTGTTPLTGITSLTAASTVIGNRINVLSATTSATITGITVSDGEGQANITRNNLSLTGSTAATVIGISETSGKVSLNLSFNHINLSPTTTSTLRGVSITTIDVSHASVGNNFTKGPIAAGTDAAILMTSGNLVSTNDFISTDLQILSQGAAANTSFKNLTLEARFGKITFVPASNITGSFSNVITSQNITQNISFFRSEATPALNVSSVVVLNNITFVLPEIWMNNLDTQYVACPADTCSQMNYTNGIFTFNVSHWTNYTLREEVAPSPCMHINASTTLTGDSGCIITNASNINLNCDGFTIFWEGNGSAVSAIHKTNITVQNCFIIDNSSLHGNNSQSNTVGINYTNVTIGLIRNNTIITNDSSSGMGIAITGVSNGVGSGISINNNTINATGSAGGHAGIKLISQTGVGNITDINITNNIIRTGGTVSQIGISISNVLQMLIANNTMLIGGTQVPIGIAGLPSFSTVIGNEILATGTVGPAVGISSSVTIGNVTITLNNISASAHAPSATVSGISCCLGNATNVNISLNFINISGSPSGGGTSAAINIQGGTFISSYGNNITTRNKTTDNYAFKVGSGVFTNFTSTNDVVLAGMQLATIGSVNNTFDNLTLENEYGRINFAKRVNITGTITFGLSEFNISQNNTYVSSLAHPFWNVSSNIVLNNLSFTNPRARVNNYDSGLFLACPADTCTVNSYEGGVFKFNVSHWTNYSASENDRPNVTNAILNSTNPLTNDTSQNLTLYLNVTDADIDHVKNITVWKEWNGTGFMPIAIVQMPFENGSSTNTSTKDYTTGINGTLHTTNGTPFFNTTGGYDGRGAYQLNGLSTTEEFIDVGTIAQKPRFNTTNLTVMAWVKLGSHRAANIIRIGGGTDALLYFMDNQIGWYNTTGFRSRSFTNPPPLRNWTLVTYVLNGDTGYYYLNGQLNQTHTDIDLKQSVLTPSSIIGVGGTSGTTAQNINGSIDEVTVFDRALTSDQIWAWYANRSVIVHNETFVGDIWQACVTPNDNLVDGVEFCSNNVTILNTAPNITSAILNTTNPSTNNTNENLTLYLNVTDIDNQHVKNITNWFVNNVSIMTLNMPFEGATNESAVRDYTPFRNNASVITAIYNSTGGVDGRGAFQFNGSGEYVEIPDNESLDFNTTGGFTVMAWAKHVNSTIESYETVLSKGSSGTCTTNYAFFLAAASGRMNFEINNGSGCAGNMDAVSTTVWARDTWYHTTGVYNGTHIMIYINGVLETTTATPTLPASNVNSLRIGWGHTTQLWNGSIDDVKIFNRSLSSEQIFAIYSNRSTIITKEETSAGDVWHACVTPNDNIVDGTEFCSNNVTVTGLSAPINLYPANNSNITDRSPNFNWSNSTGGIVAVNYSLEIATDIGFGSIVFNRTNISSLANANSTNFTINFTLETDRAYWWRVIAYDGAQFSPYSNATNFTLQSLINFSLPIRNIDFGNMSLGQQNDTVDESPRAFWLQSDGNMPINVSVTSTRLFLGPSVDYPTANYRFKARINESFAFNSSNSTLNWTNFSLTSSRMDIVDLNWTDEHDDARVDVNITVPLDEPFGLRNATVTFRVP